MALNLSSAARAMAGEAACGDQCGWWIDGARLVLAVADGLGHGPEAARAASMAIACIGARLDHPCGALFAECDRQLRDTRGAALVVAIVELDSGALSVGSVGNIRALWLNRRRAVRLDGGRGIVGAGYRDFVPQTTRMAAGDTLALFTDGVDEFPALRQVLDDPLVCAGARARVILERWGRANDDALVLCYTHEGAPIA
nr:SpoIIE family protein phosphatase [uncultured Duganella sp.]